MAASEKNDLYLQILETSHDWEFLLGTNGSFLYVSPSCERISGYSPEDLLKDAALFHRIVHAEDLSRVKDALAVRDREEKEVKCRIKHKSGRERWIGLLCTVAKDTDGQSVGIRGSIRDITAETTRKMKQDAFVVTEVMRMVGNLKKAAEGDTSFNLDPAFSDEDTESFAGLISKMDTSLATLKKSLDHLMIDAKTMMNGLTDGDFKVRVDTGNHKGEFAACMDGLNGMLDAVTVPVHEAMRVCGSFAQADFSAAFDSSIRVNGEWEEFKKSLDRMGKVFNNTVKEITRVAGAFAEGDFSAHIDESLNVRGDLVAVKTALNTVSKDVSHMIRESNRMMETLVQAAAEADASIDEVSSGTQQIARTTGNVSEHTEKATNSAQQVLQAMEDLSAAVEEVTSSAESVATLSRNADEKSQDGVRVAKRAEEGMSEINTATAEIDGIIRDINTQMVEIGKIVGVISDLAHQTNLLALNAAIEAARAGDAGRGFAVVAAEVKALATESRNSAEHITGMIQNLRSGAEKASSAMDTANQVVRDGSDQMQQTIVSFNEIVDSVSRISRSIEEVASATEEQAATVEEITASIHEVTALMERTTHEAGDTAAATEEVSASVDEVARMVTHVTGISQETLEANKKFRIA
ncbi:MAG: PAS domain S-box protein [Methanocalculus sp. MSAO_Arc1]|uniref:methyl-accepting chemotaxis protein n=1 Tax=Methanocalculus TaxID=71151 RepID=UPI000FF5303D|nr:MULTISPECIES: methyl-accepting chemotaxis protein [unclassified Methanocalculus]MCP1661580.1 PAS domain S-box-containing protein [Methanocalculus sp. AMF5]RQD82044.1 MAG: PAS domain S-box protein [Methanocalculus sp. MSAO_Arc1]